LQELLPQLLSGKDSRESEFARTPASVAIWERLKAKPEFYLKGGVGIGQKERKELVEMAKEFHRIYRKRYDQTAQTYRGFARDYGFRPENIAPSPRQPQTTGTVTFTDGKRTWHIPVDKADEFQADHPEAKRIQ
jgi:hypothetical protein